MKTITEFNGFDLIPYIQKIQELATSGKTPEEVQQAIGEAKKLEGDKLKFFVRAVELVQAKSPGLKRVIVFTAQEADKIPGGAQKHEEHYFLAEYFPGSAPAQRPGRDDRGGGRFGDKKGKRGAGAGGGGGRGRNDGRPPREGGGGGGRPPRDGARPPRADRPAGDPARLPTPLAQPIPRDASALSAGEGAPSGSGERKQRRRPPREFKPRPPLLDENGNPRPAPPLPKPLDRPIATAVPQVSAQVASADAGSAPPVETASTPSETNS